MLMIVNHHKRQASQPATGKEAPREGKKIALTLVKVGHGRLALHGVLLLSILLVCVVSLDVIPGIELEDIVFLPEVAGSELKRVAPLLVVLGIVRSVGGKVRLPVILRYFERGHRSSQLLLRIGLAGGGNDLGAVGRHG